MSKKRMKMVEAPLNIISMQPGWYLGVAISSDGVCKVGLPKLFNDVYHLEDRVDSACKGTCVTIDNCAAFVVKENYYDGVDIEDLREALENFADIAIENDIRKLAIPKLCCGKNGLKWKDVKKVIKETFRDLDIFVLVCAV